MLPIASQCPPVPHLALDFWRRTKEVEVKCYWTSTETLSRSDTSKNVFCEHPSIPWHHTDVWLLQDAYRYGKLIRTEIDLQGCLENCVQQLLSLDLALSCLKRLYPRKVKDWHSVGIQFRKEKHFRAAQSSLHSVFDLWFISQAWD